MIITDGTEEIEVSFYKYDNEYLVSEDKTRFFCATKRTKKERVYLEIETTEPEFKVV